MANADVLTPLPSLLIAHSAGFVNQGLMQTESKMADLLAIDRDIAMQQPLRRAKPASRHLVAAGCSMESRHLH